MDIKRERTATECICCSLQMFEFLLDLKAQNFTISENTYKNALQAYHEFVGVGPTELAEITRNTHPEICQVCLAQLEFSYKFFVQCQERTFQSDPACCRCCSYVQFSGDNILFDMKQNSFDFNGTQKKYIDVFLEYSGVDRRMSTETVEEPYQVCQACTVQLHNSYIFKSFCQHACKILKRKHEMSKRNLMKFILPSPESQQIKVEKHVEYSEAEEGDEEINDTTDWQAYEEDERFDQFPLEIKMNDSNDEEPMVEVELQKKVKRKRPRPIRHHIFNTLLTSEPERPRKPRPTESPEEISHAPKEKPQHFYRVKLAGPYECALCGGKYKNITYLREHINWKHLPHTHHQTYLCSECGQVFELARHLQHHKLKVHCKTRYKCTICEQVYKYSSDLKKHMFKHSGGRIGFVKCPHCSKMLKSAESVEKHIKATHDRFTCDICKKNYPCHFTLFQHKFDHLGYLPYNCPELNEEGIICNYKSKVKDHFRLHLHKVHSLRYDEVLHGYTEAKAEMLKKITEEKMNAHAHKIGLTHKCDKCPSSFQTYTGLYHHKQRSHLQVSFDCKFCDKTFTQKPSLWAHSFIHRDFYPYNCSICSYTVRNKKSMQLHLKRVHDILYSEALHGFKKETFDQVIDFVLKKIDIPNMMVPEGDNSHIVMNTVSKNVLPESNSHHINPNNDIIY